MNKRIAPTVILIVVIFIILVYTGILIYAFSQEGIGLFWKLVIILIPIGIIGALLGVYLERIKEIREEEKDDLSKY